MADSDNGDFMQMSDDEGDYSFEYDDEDDAEEELNESDQSDDQQMETGAASSHTTKDKSGSHAHHGDHVDIEQAYYIAKMAKEESLTDAIGKFQVIIDIYQRQAYTMGASDLEYCFKSVKQILKLQHHLNRFDQLLQTLPLFFQILPRLENQVYGEESISRLISHFDKPKDVTFFNAFLDQVLTGVVESYRKPDLPEGRLIPQDRLWLKLNLIKANLLDREDALQPALDLLSSLQTICESSNETVKGTYMLEIIALQMTLYTKVGDISTLRELYDKSFQINSAVPHPKIMGIIKECGGDIYMRASNYDRASNEFYESFKNYDEAGDPKRILMLKKLMVSNMLSESEINPFHSKEFQSFIKLQEIQRFASLYEAFMNADIDNFNTLVHENTDGNGIVFNDHFLTAHVEDLQTIIQLRTITSMSSHYSKLELSHLCDVLHCNMPRLQNHFLRLISSGKLIDAKLDYVDEIVEFTANSSISNILNEIDVDDIIANNLATLAEEEQAEEATAEELTTSPVAITSNTDTDGDQLMGGVQLDDSATLEPIPSTSAPLLRDKNEYIKITTPLLQTLRALFGELSHIVTNENQESIYKAKLKTALTEWLKVLQRSIPVKTADKLSQIEQVKLEQKMIQADQTLLGTDLEVEQETMMGELSLENTDTINNNISASGNNIGGLNRAQNDNFVVGGSADADADLATSATKRESLKQLLKSIQNYQDKLSRHYDERSSFANSLLKQFI